MHDKCSTKPDGANERIRRPSHSLRVGHPSAKRMLLFVAYSELPSNPLLSTGADERIRRPSHSLRVGHPSAKRMLLFVAYSELPSNPLLSTGADERIRTSDLSFTKALLCQLSYIGIINKFDLIAWKYKHYVFMYFCLVLSLCINFVLE